MKVSQGKVMYSHSMASSTTYYIASGLVLRQTFLQERQNLNFGQLRFHCCKFR